MDVLATQEPSGSTQVDLTDALSGNRSCPGSGRSCDVQQVAGGGQNFLVPIETSRNDMAGKRLSILRRWPPEIDVQVRCGILIIVEAGPQQIDQFVPSRDHGLLGRVLEALCRPGGEGPDDKGCSLELAWIHG
ncbi:hypothetical protein [Leekyejoonella antrihumi]|uniref:Uncharacterized protein n=1 Tax=Leekyejoonella antrihumi TaxID=1660198 RepID=A0A563DTB5_9MICO|nr:hypothetical protein [Leekyejoonella antrihumi]TWP33181.1 hypothetical protein FGL98_22180 [Leekyejoonella antrihumi]